MAKLLLEAFGIEMNYGMRRVLGIEELKIYDGERIGLIGENGAGKSTLLAILSGALTPDSGSVRRYGEVAAIEQLGDAEREADARLASEFGAQPNRAGLSGGERTRRRIAAALSVPSQLLLADEPTSDLDAPGVELLLRELEAYHGAIILVSHDRSLLDGLCTRILHLEDGKLQSFPGNYSAYRAELERRRAHQRDAYDQYRGEQARLRASIQGRHEQASQIRNAPSRMGNSEARLHRRSGAEVSAQLHKARKQMESRLEHMEEKQRPREDVAIRMELGGSSPISAKTALEVRYITIRTGGRTLLNNASMTLPTGSRTALLGVNGSGKTTLLRAIAEKAYAEGRGTGLSPAPADGIVITQGASTIRINPAARIGQFDQTHERTLDFERTVLENVMRDTAHAESDVRTVLARLNLRGDEVFKRVGVLSGGERGRVALAKLLLSSANLLLLDEPTNHLDVFTLEALQELLCAYRGTVLFVSHDRAFCDAVATRLVAIESGKLTTFEGSRTELNARANVDRQAEAVALEISVLQMRMAGLAARMSSPMKGDRPEQLNQDYLELAAQVRELKSKLC